MAHNVKELRELSDRIEALKPVDQAKLLEMVMTPQMRLRLLVQQVRRQGNVRDERKIDGVVNRAVQRVRRASGTR